MSKTLPQVVLRKGRSKAPRDRHPWVYSGAVERIDGSPEKGALADLVDDRGDFIARGFVNPSSQIVFRALSHEPEAIDAAFLARRLEAAMALRRQLLPPELTAYRLVHGEGDSLPGLIVDRYADVLVVQFGAAGMERLRDLVLQALADRLAPSTIWERSEGPGRRKEDLADRSGLANGVEPPELVTIAEQGVRLAVDVRRGHKTGFYLDQRPARARVRELARGRSVLDVFAYTGAFSAAALVGGAREVVAVEETASIDRLSAHLALNGLDGGVEVVRADAFAAVRQESRQFDLVVVDPPAFAKRRGEVDGACRGYKEINLQALRRVVAGGLLLTSSCSHHVDEVLFGQVLFAAAKDSRRAVRIVERIAQPSDHPVSIFHPEGQYLKTVLLQVSD